MDEQENKPMKDLPRYKCHKEVCALKIKDVCRQDGPGDPVVLPAILTFEEDGYAPIRVDASFMFKHGPQPGGYWVLDGSIATYATAVSFESGYSRV